MIYSKCLSFLNKIKIFDSIKFTLNVCQDKVSPTDSGQNLLFIKYVKTSYLQKRRGNKTEDKMKEVIELLSHISKENKNELV